MNRRSGVLGSTCGDRAEALLAGRIKELQLNLLSVDIDRSQLEIEPTKSLAS
jgi:hypothetical protein